MTHENGTITMTEQEYEALQREKEQLRQQVAYLEEQIHLLRHRLFGASSEKRRKTQAESDSVQLSLFNEAEVEADAKASEETEESDTDATSEGVETETITYERRKPRAARERDAWLYQGEADEVVEYRLSDDERVCPKCAGELHEMSREVTRRVKIIPAQMKKVEYVRYVYACRHCEAQDVETPVVRAPMPKPVQAKSLATPEAVAYVMTKKFVDGMPLYRQEQQFARHGYPLSRQTLANWVVHAAETWLEPLYAKLRQVLLAQRYLHADETTLQVLHEAGRAAQTQSYMWVYRSSMNGPPIVLYDYQETRSADHPRRFLAGFQGYLHVDGYAGYEGLPDVTLVGCWAHARRKFDEALKAVPPKERKGKTAAEEGLSFCNALYAVEKKLKNASAEERQRVRMAKSKPILDAFLAWLEKQEQQVLPKSALGRAVSYGLKQWPKLIRYVEDGHLEIDNNRCERSLKPFVIGRKNWLFANTPRGARASAVTYSIVETAKENGLNPTAYLTYLFERMPNMDLMDEAAFEALLPWSEGLPEGIRVRK
ncbi:IS66 family transposase [Alicyclobacillus sendaiensis]|uniref:IS66 family transposase n=1 Tax=Alicyclobacillus sendaiensis TaxID=192387 RepID=UPI0026F438A1|nr:IS66 family transposase [Alicyclobacillus sendaiensis]